ncbi:MAG: hypothetical protein HYX43_14405 [Burkholderiales bacterium]|nr:hypothetical protein [Burkholderiales bacterium]
MAKGAFRDLSAAHFQVHVDVPLPGERHQSTRQFHIFEQIAPVPDLRPCAVMPAFAYPDDLTGAVVDLTMDEFESA